MRKDFNTHKKFNKKSKKDNDNDHNKNNYKRIFFI